MGRRPNPDGKRLQYQIRLTAKERELIRKSAARAGVGIAEWIRRACAAYADS